MPVSIIIRPELGPRTVDEGLPLRRCPDAQIVISQRVDVVSLQVRSDTLNDSGKHSVGRDKDERSDRTVSRLSEA